MYTQKSLDHLGVGQQGCVEEIFVTGAMRRRLQDIGLTPGTLVRCLQKSPAGDPVAYLIRGAAIALRREDSRLIELR